MELLHKSRKFGTQRFDLHVIKHLDARQGIPDGRTLRPSRRNDDTLPIPRGLGPGNKVADESMKLRQTCTIHHLLRYGTAEAVF
jgi:hypothetical protein